MRIFSSRSTRSTPCRKRRTSHRRRRLLLLEKLEDRALMAVDISISDATVTEGPDAFRFIEEFASLDSPRAITFHRGDLFVGSISGDSVLRYDGTTGDLLGTFVSAGSGGLDGPFDMTFGPDGNLYVSSFVTAPEGIRRYNGSTGAYLDTFVAAWSGGLTRPTGIAFDAAGDLLVSSYDSGQILKYRGPNNGSQAQPAGVPLGVFAFTGAGSAPDFLALGPDGNVFVGLTGHGTPAPFDASIRRYHGLTGALIDTFVPTGRGGLKDVRGIVFDQDGNLVVADPIQSSVLLYEGPSGLAPGAFIAAVVPSGLGGLVIPLGITFGDDGKLYVASRDSNQLLRYRSERHAAFEVALSSPSQSPVTVNYATANGTAVAGSDYVATSGTLTFAPGETTRTILVKTLDDAIAEPSETFTVTLSNAVDATIADGQGVGTIHDASSLSPSLSISDVTATEGSITARFNGVPIGAPSSPIDHPKQIVKGTDGDYFVTSATTNSVARYDGVTFQFLGDFVGPGQGGLFDPIGLVFANGDLFVASAGTDAVLRYDGQTGAFIEQFIPSGAFGIDRPTDLVVHNNELYVSAWSGGVHRYNLATGEFLGIFVDGMDDPAGIAFGPDGNFYVVEFAVGGNNAILRFDGSTGAFIDEFVPEGSGGLTRPATITFGPDGHLYVVQNGDVFRFHGQTGAFLDIFIPQGLGGIVNATRLTFVGNQAFLVSSGNDQVMRYDVPAWAAFTVSLSSPSSSLVTVSYATNSGTATAGSDYTSATGTIIFAPGETRRTILVKTLDDAAAEPAETFTVNLSNAVGATIADSQGVGTIQDNDPVEPTLSINDITVAEEAPHAAFTVRLNVALASPVTVDYATINKTALAGLDYVATTGSVTFAPGQTTQTIVVPLINDATFEDPDETFSLQLSNPQGAAIGDSEAIALVEGNDFTWTLRASSDGEWLEVYLGHPPFPGLPPAVRWPMNSKEPLRYAADVSADDAIFVELPAGSEGPEGGILFPAGTGLNEVHVKSGSVRIDGTADGGTLNTTVAAGAELITSRLNQNGLDIAAGGRVTLLPGGETNRLTNLAVAKGATLDLGDNAVVVDYTGASPLAQIRERILSGRGGPGLGASWKGVGINSTTASEANRNDPEAFSIGFAENAALPLGPYTTFRGQPVDDTSLLIAYTRTGDANLDGIVNDDDVTIVGATYAPGVPQPHWALGDFDYNGFIDDDDVTLLGVFYNPAATPVAPLAPVATATRLQRAGRPGLALETNSTFAVLTRHSTVSEDRRTGEHSTVSEDRRTDRETLSLIDAAAIQQLLADSDDAFSAKRRSGRTLGV